jgi:hypothetical protein
MINLGPIQITEDELRVRLLAHGYELKRRHPFNDGDLVWVQHRICDAPGPVMSMTATGGLMIPDDLIKAYEELYKNYVISTQNNQFPRILESSAARIREIKARSAR